ncbi:DinB family protein [Streptomyces sp. 549]|uniref:DinB family protein n=1 Tax=Streptomyces sp. 549 TaxID=3049076 RepID=UPI0024C29061|nr:DinB family protein [Streptomyces sp. 549]MDK1472580.1 DinB family protein [Streptomyces sp. 549]
MGQRVPATGSEKETLHVSLDRHRDVVLWKLDGLGEEQLRRPMTPSGMTMLGLLKHLAAVEYGWFCETFGRPVEPLWFKPEEDFTLGPQESAEDIRAFYGRARAAADAVIRQLPVEATGTSWDGVTVSMRWVLVHMVEETARHAGHLDLMRELLDGSTGDFPAS